MPRSGASASGYSECSIVDSPAASGSGVEVDNETPRGPRSFGRKTAADEGRAPPRRRPWYKHPIFVAAVVLIVLGGIAVAIYFIVKSATKGARPAGTGKHFDRVIILIFENEALTPVSANSHWAAARAKGKLLTNYYAITHPSQPNYIALIGGDTYGVSDDSKIDVGGTSIVDQLEPKSLTWKSYQEDYPGNCYSSSTANNGLYVRKHNPFMSYTNIRTNAARCARIVASSQLATDIASNSLPDFMWYTPNMDNDGHDTSIEYAGTFLDLWLNTYWYPNQVLFNNTLLVVTFDEDDKSENNKIFTLLMGNMVTTGGSDATSYTHYSLLATIQNNWSLGGLGNEDDSATPITFP